MTRQTLIVRVKANQSPNSITPTFTKTSHRRNCGKSRRHKLFRHVEMVATKSVTSQRQTRLCRLDNGNWSVKMHGESWLESRRQSLRIFMIRVRNKIRKLCRKFGVMEFRP